MAVVVIIPNAQGGRKAPLKLSTTLGYSAGQLAPFMLVGIAPVAIAFVLTFALPSSLSPVTLAVWLAALSIAMRVSMSLFILPDQAVAAALPVLAATITWFYSLDRKTHAAIILDLKARRAAAQGASS